jgi:hypothetical protein
MSLPKEESQGSCKRISFPGARLQDIQVVEVLFCGDTQGLCCNVRSATYWNGRV